MLAQPNIYKVLDHIKTRPGMFLGNNWGLDALNSFIAGFQMAASTTQMELDEFPNFGYFNTWIIGHLDKHFGQSGGWHWQISNRNPDNHQQAFDEFFYFLEIFKKSKMQSKSILIDPEALAFYKKNTKRSIIIDGKETPLNDEPYKIVWKTLTHSTTVWLDYLDKDEVPVEVDYWSINSTEANKRLQWWFGHLKNNWVNIK
jgi:hypothetical protein